MIRCARDDRRAEGARRRRAAAVAAFALIAAAAAAPAAADAARAPAAGPLRVLDANPRYFTDGSGKAVYLAGSHSWGNLQDFAPGQEPLDYDRYVAFLVSHDFNFIRLWTFWVPHGGLVARTTVEPPYPWLRTGPARATDGGLAFDFRRFDQAYFDRLRSRVARAGESGIYVAVMLFDGYEFQFAANAESGDPFAAPNNVNGIDCGGTCPTDMSRLPAAAWAVEQAYLRKVVDTVNDLDNVLYEVSNEAGAPYSDTWQAAVIRYVRQYEATKPKRHPIGMTFQYAGGSDKTLLQSEADWISPSARVAPDARGAKVVINDTDHSFYYTALQAAGVEGQRAWAWENFMRGNNLAFMDPYLTDWPGRNSPRNGATDPSWEEIRRAMTDIRGYAEKIDLAHMTPRQDLAGEGTVVLASPGSQYLAFEPRGAQAVTLAAAPGTYVYEWFDPARHTVVETGKIDVAEGHAFAPPIAAPAVLWLHK